MSGKNIVFKTEVMSPIHGTFRAGDIGKNIDAAWAGDLIAAGYASETSAATQKADADAAADAAGKLTSANRGGSKAHKVEHSFSSSDLAAQRAAGVVTTGPTDSTVGAERTAARMDGKAPAPAVVAGDAALAPRAAPVAARPAKTAPARVAPTKAAKKAAKGKTSSRK